MKFFLLVEKGYDNELPDWSIYLYLTGKIFTDFLWERLLKIDVAKNQKKGKKAVAESYSTSLPVKTNKKMILMVLCYLSINCQPDKRLELQTMVPDFLGLNPIFLSH